MRRRRAPTSAAVSAPHSRTPGIRPGRRDGGSRARCRATRCLPGPRARRSRGSTPCARAGPGPTSWTRSQFGGNSHQRQRRARAPGGAARDHWSSGPPREIEVRRDRADVAAPLRAHRRQGGHLHDRRCRPAGHVVIARAVPHGQGVMDERPSRWTKSLSAAEYWNRTTGFEWDGAIPGHSGARRFSGQLAGPRLLAVLKLRITLPGARPKQEATFRCWWPRSLSS